MAIFVVAGAAAFGLALLLDRWAYSSLTVKNLRQNDWYRMFRVVGFLPVWAIVAAALFLIGSARPRAARLMLAARRTLLLFVPVLLSSGLAEGLKLVLRRERPYLTGGAYVFRSWQDGPLESAGLGLPSSHTAVAFAAAWALCLLYPQAAPVWLMLAIGCAVSRLLMGAHFLSDVVLSAVVSYAVVRLIWQWCPRSVRHAAGESGDVVQPGPCPGASERPHPAPGSGAAESTDPPARPIAPPAATGGAGENGKG